MSKCLHFIRSADRGHEPGIRASPAKTGLARTGAFGGGNQQDPENDVIACHAGIRGDTEAQKSWNWETGKPDAEGGDHAASDRLLIKR